MTRSKRPTQRDVTEAIERGERFATRLFAEHWEPIRRELASQWLPEEARAAMTAIDRYLEQVNR